MRLAPAAYLPVTILLGACQIEGLPETLTGRTSAPADDGPLRVVAAEASASRVTLRVSDGSRCIGTRPEGVQSGWDGATDPECGYSIPYRVMFRQGGAAQRFTIEDPGMPLGADGTPGPRAEVFVTDIDGQRKLFLSPLGAGTRLETPAAPAS